MRIAFLMFSFVIIETGIMTAENIEKLKDMNEFEKLAGKEKASYFNSLEISKKFEFLKIYLKKRQFIIPIYDRMKFLDNGVLLFDGRRDEGGWLSFDKKTKKVTHFKGKWEIKKNQLIIFTNKNIGISDFKSPSLFVDVEMRYTKLQFNQEDLTLIFKEEMSGELAAEIREILDEKIEHSPSFRTYKQKGN